MGEGGLYLEPLIAEAGRGGGRIGLVVSTLKKLDLRLIDDGEGGICEIVSIVLSDSDGLGLRFSLGVSGRGPGVSDIDSLASPSPANDIASCEEAFPDVPGRMLLGVGRHLDGGTLLAKLDSEGVTLFVLLDEVVSVLAATPTTGLFFSSFSCALHGLEATGMVAGFQVASTDPVTDPWRMGNLAKRGIPDAGLEPCSISMLKMGFLRANLSTKVSMQTIQGPAQ